MELEEKNPPDNAGGVRDWFNPWVGKIPWRRAWQPTPVFLPGESHGQKAWQVTVYGVAESDVNEETQHSRILSNRIYSHHFIT